MDTRTRLLGTLIAASIATLAIAPANAQETGPATSDTAVMGDDRRDDDGFDWGLLGLLGLLGLIPRKSKEVVVHRDDTTRTGTGGTNRL